MPRLEAINPENATGEARKLLDTVQAKTGRAPNIVRTLAASPAALKAYLGFSGALKESALSDPLRECIALTVAEENDCDYCRAAHTAGGKLAGLSDEDMVNCRKGESSDSKTQAAIRFARRVVETRGWVEDRDLDEVRGAGWGEGEIVDMVATVALNLFTNYFNHVAGTEVDFPTPPSLDG